MADFCAADERLMGVAHRAARRPGAGDGRAGRSCWSSGLEAVWVPHRPCGERSPGHVDLDPFWARLGRERHAVRAARRRRAAAAGQGLDEQRPRADQGLAGRRREPAHQGHRAAARGAGEVPHHDGARRRVRAPSRPARRLRRARRRLGAGAAAPARLGGEELGPHRRQPAGLQAHAVRADHPAAGLHAVRVRGGRRPDRPVEPRPLPVLHRLSAHRGRPQPDRPVRGALGERGEAVRDKFYAENFLRIFPDARVDAPAAALA